ncbi:hypothetical protein [Pseudomonas sp. P9_31]|uniref:hypothetical protein n=1 Tax=Pseudomonas sp. P9_31 TaxID=3043448 RepID=UPI002A35C858|nr:hypothetical protein [Pseudomonas sp. P9_31]WPN56843.1 hypothetical protein QMK51_22305 [Pseudomonas sp. P9_31]
MENQRTPAGKRITRLSFSLVTQQIDNGITSYHLERCTHSLGLNAAKEEVLNLWCEIAGDYLTVTMIVSPFGSQPDLIRAGNEMVEWVKTTGPRRKIKKGQRKVPIAELEAAECAEADEILLRMWNHVESMEQRQVIYKMSEITGPVEWADYLPPTEKPKRLTPGDVS